MKFRYKIEERYDSCFNVMYHHIKIQEYISLCVFNWSTIYDDKLVKLLDKIDPEPFIHYHNYSEIPSKKIFEVLNKYNNIEEIIMKYITDIVLPEYKAQKDQASYNDLIKKFVLTNDWKTIEVKESNE